MDTPTFETGRPKMAADVVDAGALLRTTVFFTSFFLAVTVIKYVSGDYSGYQERGNLSDKAKYATKIFKKFSGAKTADLIPDGRRRNGSRRRVAIRPTRFVTAQALPVFQPFPVRAYALWLWMLSKFSASTLYRVDPFIRIKNNAPHCARDPRRTRDFHKHVPAGSFFILPLEQGIKFGTRQAFRSPRSNPRSSSDFRERIATVTSPR